MGPRERKTLMLPTNPRRAAECIAARYQHEPWFLSAESRDGGVMFLVKPSCPFATHRKIGRFAVRVVVAELCGQDHMGVVWTPKYARPDQYG